MTSFYDCLALFIACLFVLLWFALGLLTIAAMVYVIVYAAAAALKAAGVIHLLAMAL